jgi:hypothetical protein
MSISFLKQPCSRINRMQNLNFVGATIVSAAFGVATQHVGIISNVSAGGWFCIDNGATAMSTLGGVGVILPPNIPLFFITTPGQTLTFTSSTTSSGVVSVFELA